MKVKLSYIIGVMCVTAALLCGLSAKAQEGSPVSNDLPEVNNHTELNSINDDKPLLSDPEGTNRFQSPSNQLQSHAPAGAPPITTTATITKSKGKSSDQKVSNKDEDALSFNFLFYIIQKFKKSDIVDD